MTWVTSPGGEAVVAPKASPHRLGERAHRELVDLAAVHRDLVQLLLQHLADWRVHGAAAGDGEDARPASPSVWRWVARMPRCGSVRRAEHHGAGARRRRARRCCGRSQSIRRVSSSTPMTSARLTSPVAMYWSAMDIAVERPGAGRRDVEGERLLGAELGLHEHRAGRHRHVGGDGADDDQVELARARVPRHLQRPDRRRSPPCRT